MTELEKAFKQKIVELEKENKLLRMKCMRIAEENRSLQEDKADLRERILDLEACK